MKTSNLTLLALLSAVLFSSCSGGKPADGSGTEKTDIAIDGEFIEGYWVDENGVVFYSNGDKISGFTADFTRELYFENSVATATVYGSPLIISAVDSDTVRIENNGEVSTAYRAQSETALELTEHLSQELIGCWNNKECDRYYIFNEETYEVIAEGYNAPSDYSISGSQINVGDSIDSTSQYIRIDGDTLTIFKSSGDITDLCRTDPEIGIKPYDISDDFSGTWINAANPHEIWKLSNDGTLYIGDEIYSYSAYRENGEEWFELDGSAPYKADIAYREIELTGDSEKIILYDTYYYNQKELVDAYTVKTQNAELFEIYPDTDNWLEENCYGDIPLLADPEYIQRSVKAGTFVISTPSELASFNYYVNTNCGEPIYFAVLTNDIDLKGYEWAPMGWVGNSYEHPFQGIFDGNNFTISNMKIKGNDNCGFIGWGVFSRAKNITFENAYVSGSTNIAVLTGQSIGCYYENCTVSGKVSGSSAGSLLGHDANSDITNCTADVTVNGEAFDFLTSNEKAISEIHIENPVVITIDENHTVTRPEDIEYYNIHWTVNYNGRCVLQRNARNELSYTYFGDSPGTYEIYLEAAVSGQYVPISNTVSYTIE